MYKEQIWNQETLGKKACHPFFGFNCRFLYFKPKSENTNPKQILVFLVNPIPLIIKVGSQSLDILARAQPHTNTHILIAGLNCGQGVRMRGNVKYTTSAVLAATTQWNGTMDMEGFRLQI